MKKNPFIKVMTIFIVIIVGISLIWWSAIMLLWDNTTENNVNNPEYIENEINEPEIISEEDNLEIEDETGTWDTVKTGDINIAEIE